MTATDTKGHCAITDTQSQKQQAEHILPESEKWPKARHGDRHCNPSLR